MYCLVITSLSKIKTLEASGRMMPENPRHFRCYHETTA